MFFPFEIGSTITEGLSLKIYDFAGQEIFYATHQLFLMSQAVFLLVFDLSLDLNDKAVAGRYSHPKNLFSAMVRKVANFLGRKKNVNVYEITNLDFIIFWLSSIYAHTVENKRTDGAEARQLSPPVFITGTHENNLPGNKSQRKAKAEQIFETIRTSIKQHPCSKHVVTRYYAVDSSLRNDVEILKLQQHILEVVREEPYMSNLIPVSWLDLELTLEEKQKDMYMLEMADVRSVAAKCGVNDSEELSTFLQFQHNTGNCVYFENKMNVDDPLNHYVILNQRWLNDMFIGVITIRPAKEQFAQFSDSWSRLESGLLDEKLARHVWRNYHIDPNLLFNLMTRFDLLCEIQFSAEEAVRRLAEKSRVFCLPCCLSETIEAPAVVEDDNRTVRFFVDFNGFFTRWSVLQINGAHNSLFSGAWQQ
ncbi:probable serine/threonine-protein kinase roco5 [Anneissia japonica]|uniref:probable serine/threonine-protein kinase roco5 n=1 Tax=Anneissia japonica TaxID=1529436 RepID=UPI0014254B9E|nr:probable serine/threonine-protein kinase roco5 [Anneissia japonica]